MTMETPVTDRPPILTGPTVRLLVTSVGSLGGFYLLMPVVPLYVATSGAGNVGAGLATGVMMLATVLTELAMPRVLRRYGYRTVMALGLLLLGAPATVLAASAALPVVLAVCLVRGAGLGVLVVAGAALIAELVPPERRGEGFGIYGVAVGVPPIACLPLGLWLVPHVGYRPVFLAGAALSLLPLVAALGLPARPAAIEQHGSVLGALRSGARARPALVFTAVTIAAGIVHTFLPVALAGRSAQLAAVALLVQSCVTPFARWTAGWSGDRHGTARLLVPGVLAAAVGAVGLIWYANPVAVLAGMVLFGIGFGVAQNVTLALLFERVAPSDFGRASALWNLAYDGGIGIGAVGFGLLVGPVGYPTGFAITAAVLFAALLPAWRDLRLAVHERSH
jgi:MFS family permease